MYLLGYSLNNLSLMALTIAAGFVVDDAIIVLENISRHVEAGMSRVEAALQGAREVGFTVVSMSLSLIAVFIPILLMSGIVGRLFREFAVTLSVAILISMVVSLTTTPMMCAYVLRQPTDRKPGLFFRASERAFGGLQWAYGRSLNLVLRHPRLTMLVFLATVLLNVHLYTTIRRASFPSRIQAASSAASAPTRASRFRRCGVSSGSTWRSSAPIRRSRASRASPAASRPTPASSSPR